MGSTPEREEPEHKQRQLPQQRAFDVLRAWRTAGAWLVYAVSGFSVAVPLLGHLAATPATSAVLSTAHFLNYLLIIAYFVVSIVSEVFLYPAAARQRRLNLIDNALGSRFLGQDSQGYFSNDDVPSGAYKLCVNCFENCHFTYNISKAMVKAVAAKGAILALGFLFLAYVGIRESYVALPILQVLLSSIFLADVIHHLSFTAKLGTLMERFRQYFMDAITNPAIAESLQYPIALLMDYETALAYNKAPMSDRVYNAMRQRLSSEWDEIKAYYRIGK